VRGSAMAMTAVYFQFNDRRQKAVGEDAFFKAVSKFYILLSQK
jgi:hypothetical protein